MKKIKFLKIMLVVGTLGFLSSAYTEEFPTVNLLAFLNIERKCKPNTPICAIRQRPIRSEAITLLPQFKLIGKSPLPTAQEEFAHYRGLWSDVRERDGLRFIAIISVDRFLIERGENEEKRYSYGITVEIFDASGVTAKMTISVDSIAQLNNAVLVGRTVTHMDNEYIPSFIIGRGAILCPIGQACSESKMNNSNAKWDVLLGDLQ